MHIQDIKQISAERQACLFQRAISYSILLQSPFANLNTLMMPLVFKF